MKQIEKRLSKLEQSQDPEKGFNGFSFVIETKEQAKHPERFRKVPVTDSKFLIFKLDRK